MKPNLPRIKFDVLSYAGIAMLVAGIIIMIYGYRFGVLRVQIIGIMLIVIGGLVAFVRPVISSYLGGPKVDLDLIYALLHMRLVASGKPPAGKVLESVSDVNLYGKYSQTFGRAVLLAREWGYNLSDALSYLAKEIKEKAFREVVQRLAATVKLGADLELFLSTEYDTLLNEYQFHYQRTMNNMRVLLGVYVATMAALVFALSSFVLLGFFFGGSSKLIVQAFIAGLLVAVGLGAMIILLLPREFFDVKGREARENKTIKLIDILAIVATFIGAASALLYMKGHPIDTKSLSIALVLIGVPYLVPGFLALRLESFIEDVDIFFPVFIRSLGSFIATIPSLKHAIRQVLRTDLGKLTRLIQRFHVRLENEIPPQIAWRRFALESGSELVRRGSRMFQDTIEYGGDTVLAGRAISDHNNILLGLRRLRAQVSANFTSTAIVIHASVVAISVFILGLVAYFNQVIQTLTQGIAAEIASYFFLSPIDLVIINKAIYVFIGALTIINAYLIALVRPYSLRAFWYYLGLLMVVTGVSAYLSAASVEYVLRTMAGVQIAPIPTT